MGHCRGPFVLAVRGDFITAVNVYLAKLNDPFIKQHTLIRGLAQFEVAIADVNNQPGWYIADTARDQFLVRVADSNGVLIEPLTTKQRIRFFPAKRENLDPQTMIVRFAEDEKLTAKSPYNVGLRYNFTRLTSFGMQALSGILYEHGIDRLLSLEAQRTPEVHLASYDLGSNLVLKDGKAPNPNANETLDFNGSLGLYYWEVFFHIPFFIANRLNANQKFEDAQRWYHYIFNPTTSDKSDDGVPNNRFWRFLQARGIGFQLFKINADCRPLSARP